MTKSYIRRAHAHKPKAAIFFVHFVMPLFLVSPFLRAFAFFCSNF